MANQLFYGDNLTVLRESIPTASVDLIYLDPPFNSQANYNVLFKSPAGKQSEAQVHAFEDTWHWDDAAELAFDLVMRGPNSDVADMLRAMRSFLKENDMMAYLSMMAVRLVELHRVLKPAGSLFLHCDPTASHYLKVLLDAIFGKDRFMNEIVWRRTGSHNSRKSFGRIHDVILAFTASKNSGFEVVRRPYMRGHVESRYSADKDGKLRFSSGGNVLTGAGATGGPSCEPWRGFDPGSKGRHWALPSFYEDLMDAAYLELSPTEKLEALYQAKLIEIQTGNAWPTMVRYLEERDGTPVGDIWAYQPYTQGTVWGTKEGIDEDVKWLGPTDPERLGYPTQKPVSLLERIVAASSRPGDVVLDPFCGCGTAVHAAQKLERQWIGIDITHLAISLIEKRLRDAFPEISFEVHGTPTDIDAARDLFHRDPYQFQWWAVSLVNAVPYGGKKRGADSGIDGHIYFKPDGRTTEKAIVSVKGGHNVSVPMIRDLGHVVDRERAKVGIFITLAEPTGPMKVEAVKAGFYETSYGKFPKLQILTIADLFSGRRPHLPWLDNKAFRQAPREHVDNQGKFAFG